MTSSTRTVRDLLVALYAWLVTVYLGAVALDVVYSRLLAAASAAAAAPVFGEVSDFLLLVGGLAVLAAVGAMASSAGHRAATHLLSASVACLLFELLGPVLLLPLLGSSSSSPRLPLLRLLPIALASLLAFAALRRSLQDSGPRSPGNAAAARTQ